MKICPTQEALSSHLLDRTSKKKVAFLCVRIGCCRKDGTDLVSCRFSNVDMSSQEAYELAVRGLLGPDGKSAPILTGLRCVHFQPPSFTLEVQCLNETQKYLRKVVHEIGLELRSTAVCKHVRRTRDGLFTSRQALTRNQWSAADVLQAVQQHRCTEQTEKTARQRSEESPAPTRQSKADVMSSRRGKEHGS
uniref:tRNA pseudouridine synthase 2 n=1 Tax=Oryzias sinensis TaxID=183150 RepID=A0A8C7Z801_9TELE